ncbi:MULTISPECIES: HNH endonuclease [unclassified Mesorhizobium]|uniref:HNH endonuclease n=1 Tax=unclassified Mesorhizobium TaxID=325217 RepID=UPI000F762821|nr:MULTISPECIES: HNH endonuclease [unclassified Mesorhizobium]AZO06740.1 restriction endonuclease [Mesorhizobium sp. M2A.F.Ca.ET.043.02.1.1]RUW40646.1 restriction endonuclease [Mesorhizobium sp. M2A.F.Ca.ET.015.02.1.1]RVC95257.1 restriction endonuclease [Mesorhizobium sp. M2A.F.Ca.ET.017.03.2.1]RVD07020.1 restriction endonuclease [Mesorhizobium sp. M2A.F.Ca.ET.029.05.1.1]RWB42513.1 MAG: restriction endonuclease [Mesorhizobium sp.]
MAFGVFIHRTDSIYDDSPAEQYQFPRQYLRRVEACVGDWIIYYEPSKVTETRGYFAMAKVQQVIPDLSAPDMYLALIEPGTYLDFVNPVPFSGADGLVERGLLNNEGRISGRAQSAVRALSPADFNRIIDLAFDASEVVPRVEETGFQEEQAPFQFEQSRDRANYIGSRIVRDRIFRRIVLRAYDERCAITGLKLINGGGRAEVSAAHIRPVERNGPDVINNGIALSGTAHWMFDRGLISLSDDLEILISRQVNDVDSVQGFINKTRRALLPSRLSERPHPRFLQWHREHCFKQ